MALKDLKKEIPYKWKVQAVSKAKPVATCVPYVDARDVERLLDDVCGQQGWQNEYYQVKNTLYCKIGIKCDDGWIWKSNAGAESAYDKEKGEASDAFKRAGVKWGIGRFLYGTKPRFCPTNAASTGKNRPYPVNEHGKRIWDLTEYFKKNSPKPEIPENIGHDDANVVTVTDEQVITLQEICDSKNFPRDETLKAMANKIFRVDDIYNLPAKDFETAKTTLNSKQANEVKNETAK